uniref:FBP7 n=1 Tax=Arundo donax TaxID=35708 RepID=A0A0A9CYA9_ARUDO
MEWRRTTGWLGCCMILLGGECGSRDQESEVMVSMLVGTHIFTPELQSGNSRKLSMWFATTVI